MLSITNQIKPIHILHFFFNRIQSSWASWCGIKAHTECRCCALPLCSHRLRYAQCAIITESLSGFSADSQTAHTVKASFLMLISLQTFPPAPLSHKPLKPGRSSQHALLLMTGQQWTVRGCLERIIGRCDRTGAAQRSKGAWSGVEQLAEPSSGVWGAGRLFHPPHNVWTFFFCGWPLSVSELPSYNIPYNGPACEWS